MPRKGDRKVKPISGETSNPRSLGSLLRAYLSSLEVRNYSLETIGKYRRHLNHFIDWALERSLESPAELTRPILERYQPMRL